MTNPMPEALDTAIAEQLERRHIPGAAVAVVHCGELLFARGYGLADLEWQTPVAPDTVFEIASVTKTFTATAVLLLAREDRLDLATSITSYLPELSKHYVEVTLRHLLSHTGGVLRDGLDGYWKSPAAIARDFSRDEMLAMISNAPLSFSPGASYAYSNSAYFLLGLVVDRVSGQTFSSFMNERIFSPLGMNQTRVATRREVVPKRASGYCWEQGHYRNAPYCGLEHHNSNGGMLSTVLDLARWDRALTTETLLSASEWDAAWMPVPLDSGAPALSARDALGLGHPNHTGLGWGLGSYRGHRTTGHAGALPGFTSQFTHYRDLALTIIVLCNNWMGEDGRGHAPVLARVVADKWLPEPAPRSPAELAASAYWEGDYLGAAHRWCAMIAAGETNPEADYLAARAFSRAGELEDAWHHLDRALARELNDPKRALDETDLEPLRSDPRWEKLAGP